MVCIEVSMMYLYRLTLENNNNFHKVKYAVGMYQSSNYVPLQIDNTE